MKKKSDSKKTIITIIVIVIVAAVGSRYAPEIRTYFTYIHPTKNRVKFMLNNIKGPVLMEYGAISQWAKGVSSMGKEEVERYAMAFDEFRREKDIFPSINSFSIDKLTVVDDGFVKPFVRVSCTIDGRKLTMIVRKNEPISWATR